MNTRPLPTEIMARTDVAYEHADYGDSMIRLTRWLRRLSIPTAVLVGAAVGFVGSMLATWLSAAGLLAGFFVMIWLQTRVCRVPWANDFRQPVLILRSFTDQRTKAGGTLAAVEFDPSPGGRNPYVWQLPQAIWDWGRVILLQEEENDAGLEVFGIVLTPDKDWESVVLDVARKSWAIVVFPADTPGSVAELRLLDEHGLLHKTVVFMPPMPSARASILGALFGTPADESHDVDWEGLRRSLAQQGFQLPKYDRQGMLYVPTASLDVDHGILLRHNDCPWRRLPELLPKPGCLAEPLWNVLNHGQAFEADDPTRSLGGVAGHEVQPGKMLIVQDDSMIAVPARRDHDSGVHIIELDTSADTFRSTRD